MKKSLCAFIMTACLFLPCKPQTAAAEVSIGKKFVGETLTYNIGIFWFGEAFYSVINLQPGAKPGEYVAVLWGKTQGFIGWLTSYRERLFVSYLEEIDGGRRFRTRYFETTKIKGSKKLRERHDFDYERKKWRIRVYHDDNLMESVEKDLPSAAGFEDILSAFYNLRFGVYGPLSKGKSYSISSFSRDKGVTPINVTLLSQAEQDKHRLHEEGDLPRDYLARVELDKELFSSRDGIVWVWLSPEIVPKKGIVEDAVGFGDIYGNIKEARLSQETPAAFIPPFLRYKSLFPQGINDGK